jgi:hypothetical protein
VDENMVLTMLVDEMLLVKMSADEMSVYKNWQMLEFFAWIRGDMEVGSKFRQNVPHLKHALL